MLDGTNTFFAWYSYGGEPVSTWQPWKGTNSGFDQSAAATTNNDAPMPIPSPAVVGGVIVGIGLTYSLRLQRLRLVS